MRSQAVIALPRKRIFVEFTPLNVEELKPAMRRALDRLERARTHFLLQCEDESYASSLVSEQFWLDQSRELRHPLSDKWLSVQPRAGVRVARSLVNEADLSQVGSSLLSEGLLGDPAKFEAWICLINAAALGKNAGSLRAINVASNADIDGWYCSYCAPRSIRPKIGELCHFLSKTAETPAIAAVLALAGILVIHPFEDGNGRTARAVFNAIIGQGAKIDAFLPLQLIFDSSLGGYDIRLRELQVNKNWAPLIHYFTSLLLAR